MVVGRTVDVTTDEPVADVSVELLDAAGESFSVVKLVLAAGAFLVLWLATGIH